MADKYSFDIVSDVDMQEVHNAVDNALREISNRYDFKGCTSEITLGKDEIKILAQDDFKLKAMKEILNGKLIKRGISVKALDFGKEEDANMGTKRQTAKIVKGISKEKAKEISSDIKKSKLKVQTQILDNQLRITSKDKDILQQVIALVKGNDYNIALQFTNYR